ncbi:cytochrome P450 [Lentzea tibetensis]|uniref:Cytochrome P450 n=1 Tax=Lentzea tibetensis TaxID=2591470 RepID=A0A563F2N2_9PSEU|nr:cytochrome P450 [Lentzea tibetensis]TWP53614.1 cytochrome P450 [Lentzea tibetensis]
MPMATMPRRLPLLGHAAQMLLRPREFVSSIREHGDVVRFQLGPKPAYMVNDPDLINEMLTVQRTRFTKGGPMCEQAVKMIGNGIFASEGDYYRRQRRLVQPGFHHQRIADYTDVMREVSETTANSWRDGQVVDVKADTAGIALHILTRTLFAVDDWEEVAAELHGSIPAVLGAIGRRALLPVDFVHELPFPINRRTNEAQGRLFELVDSVITAHRSAGTDHGDLLSSLMFATDPETGETMSDREVRDELITMFSAGLETAGTTMSWFFHVLASHPDVESRVHAEVDEVLGGRPVTFADLSTLDYLRRVLKETLRTFTPVWLLTRNTAVDCTIGGHHIPAGADVFFSAYGVHHDPRFYPRPHDFDPDRWLPENAAGIPRHAYLPFGGGARKCVGEGYAMTEMVTVLATLTSRWRLRPVAGRPMRPVVKSTYAPRDLLMTAHAR